MLETLDTKHSYFVTFVFKGFCGRVTFVLGKNLQLAR